MPKFLPDLPRPQQKQLDATVEREVAKFRARVLRGSRAKSSTKPKKGARGRTPKQA